MSPKNKQAGYVGLTVDTADAARMIVKDWLKSLRLDRRISVGAGEINLRHRIWQVTLCSGKTGVVVGEAAVDATTAEIMYRKSTRLETLRTRLRQSSKSCGKRPSGKEYVRSTLPNTIALGDSGDLLRKTPAGSVDLIMTSPPYFNAMPEYSEFVAYESYLAWMRSIIRLCHGVLAEGRFFVINSSPVLLRRPKRNASSHRLALPFDLHRLFIEEGFEFIDDIIWLKPEGAGWASGRGRRFARDRNPLQYKAVPVTEYVIVYRKQSDTLIDWHIRKHPDREAVRRSRIPDGYEKTNVWKMSPASKRGHPAVFPFELAEKVIRYYSFEGDVVLDPFAGSGTVGAAAASLNRRFVLYEKMPDYVELMCKDAGRWSINDPENIRYWNCEHLRC